ncbi:unnamed protein product [Closterium sp. NIES-53]
MSNGMAITAAATSLLLSCRSSSLNSSAHLSPPPPHSLPPTSLPPPPTPVLPSPSLPSSTSIPSSPPCPPLLSPATLPTPPCTPYSLACSLLFASFTPSPPSPLSAAACNSRASALSASVCPPPTPVYPRTASLAPSSRPTPTLAPSPCMEERA